MKSEAWLYTQKYMFSSSKAVFVLQNVHDSTSDNRTTIRRLFIANNCQISVLLRIALESLSTSYLSCCDNIFLITKSTNLFLHRSRNQSCFSLPSTWFLRPGDENIVPSREISVILIEFVVVVCWGYELRSTYVNVRFSGLFLFWNFWLTNN